MRLRPYTYFAYTEEKLPNYIDPEALIEQATNSEEFDVLDFAEEVGLPTVEHKLYTNARAAKRLHEILDAEKERDEQKIADAKAGAVHGLDEGYAETDEDEVNALYAELEETAIVFELRGLAPAAQKAIEKHTRATKWSDDDADQTAYWTEYNLQIISKSIVSASRGGRKDTKTWTPERVAALEGKVYDYEFSKFVQATTELTFVGAVFDQFVTADFS